MIPIPPAFETAEASCAPGDEPIGAWMIGISMPSMLTHAQSAPRGIVGIATRATLDNGRDRSVKCAADAAPAHRPPHAVAVGALMLEAVKDRRARRRDPGRRGRGEGRAARHRDRRARGRRLPARHARRTWGTSPARSSTSSTRSTTRASSRPSAGPSASTCTATATRPAPSGRSRRSPPGWRWKLAAEARGGHQPARPATDLDACWDLGATLAAGLTLSD